MGVLGSPEKEASTVIRRKEPGVIRWQWIGVLFLVSHGLLAGGTGAAERTRPFLIGALNDSWGPTPADVGLRGGLVALGYREDKDFFLGVRFTQGDTSALPAAARDLVQQGADLIFVVGDEAVKAAQQATSQIPIVFGVVADPMALGSIERFARPGGNVTGVTGMQLNLGPKRLQVFQEMMPTLQRVLFVYNSAVPHSAESAGVYQDAARRLGIALTAKPVRTQAEAQATLRLVRRGEVDSILAPSGITLNIPGFVLETGKQRRLPTLFDSVFYVEHGGLASYGPDFYETGRQAARLVDKILKGAKPAKIPVEVNSKIEFAINLKTAKALGLTIAPEVLFQADRVVR
jgi:putative ABC transport system substrate-binding protein